MNSTELRILRTTIKAFPAVVPHLKGRARWVAFADMYQSVGHSFWTIAKGKLSIYGLGDIYEIKSYDYFLQQLERLVRSVYAGNLGGEFMDVMANLISGQLTDAYRQAWEADEGEGELPDYLTASLDKMILGQYEHVDQLYRDIVDARVDELPTDPLLTRAGHWAQQWNTAYREAERLINVAGGGNLIWRKGETEHGCDTCATLDGIVARAAEWEALGVHPRGYPNSKLECQGGGPANYCDCTLEPTDQRRSRGAYGRIEEAIL
jgi:hypothetical protein